MQEEALRTNLEEYHSSVKAVTAAFKGTTVKIDGLKSIDDIKKNARAVCTKAAEAEDSRRQGRLVKVLGPAVFLNVISGAMLWTARQVSAHRVV